MDYRLLGFGSLSYIGRSSKKVDAQWHSLEFHIGGLRSFENSERTRAACVKFMQNRLRNLYPERVDLVEKTKQMVGGFGGRVTEPQLSWKWSWIETLFGRRAAKRAQVFLQGLRLSVERSLDKGVLRVQGQKPLVNQKKKMFRVNNRGSLLGTQHDSSKSASDSLE